VAAGSQIGGIGEIGAVPGFGNLAGQADGEHRFADAGRPDEQNVGAGLSAAVSSATTTGRSWSQRHPYTDGAILGPLLFLALETLLSLSVWWCAVGGIVGVIAGVALGSRRARRQRSASSTT
jgi:hypothetical protein